MRQHKRALCWAAAACVSLSQPAFAQDEGAQIDGTASAEVVAPSRVEHVADLRFGAFASPSGASTLRVGVDGSVVPTGSVASAMYVTQPPEGRGPAQFKVEQDGSRFFILFYPRSVNITSDTDSMLVNSTTGRLVRTVTAGRNSEYRFDMGGTLNIGANQETGSYAGEFLITVIYL